LPTFNTIVIPDLIYYFSVFVKSSSLNKDEVPFPVQLSLDDLGENRSFIRLLFDEKWPAIYTYYYSCYEATTSGANWPPIVLTRAKLYPNSSKYYEACDCTSSSAINVFNLDSTTIVMLDQLLLYRLNPTGYTLSIPYSSLTTNLSKMIWIYLDLKVNGNYSNFDNTTPLSDPDSTLENMYEVYLTDLVFDFVQTKSNSG
jgi:hypothetical protein